MMDWPKIIERDGERFQFVAERPGWLVYANDEHQILVGKIEARGLAVVPAAK